MPADIFRVTAVYDSYYNPQRASINWRPTEHSARVGAVYEKALSIGYRISAETPSKEKLNKLWVPVISPTDKPPKGRGVDFYLQTKSKGCNPTLAKRSGEIDKVNSSYGYQTKIREPINAHTFSLEEFTRFVQKFLQMVPQGITDDQIFTVEKEVVKIVETIREIEVDKIVIQEVIKVIKEEIPIALSFETREILTNALHREQHIINEQIRLAMLDNSEGRASVLVGRINALYETMRQFNISRDSYDNTKVWLMESNFSYNEPLVGEDDQVVAFPLEN